MVASNRITMISRLDRMEQDIEDLRNFVQKNQEWLNNISSQGLDFLEISLQIRKLIQDLRDEGNAIHRQLDSV
jgi:uncharacterized protein (UPF0335 family)